MRLSPSASIHAAVLGLTLTALGVSPLSAQEHTPRNTGSESAAAARNPQAHRSQPVESLGKGNAGDEVIAPIVNAIAAPVAAAAAAVTPPTNAKHNLDALVARHAAAHNVPPELIRRVIKRESGGNPRAVSKGNYGLMQIRLGTARAMGYRGDAAGLLDADTNMTYAVKYLAGAYRVAGGSHDRAVSNYARGYYYEAKRQGINAYALANATPSSASPAAASPVAPTISAPIAGDPPTAVRASDAAAGNTSDSRANIQ